jgi:hypothetical protein
LIIKSKITYKKVNIMALETRPLPVLKGKVLKEFLEKVKNFKISETPEEVREANRWVQETIDEEREIERQERDDKLKNRM